MLVFPSRRSHSPAVVRPDPALLFLPSEPALQRLLQTTKVLLQPVHPTLIKARIAPDRTSAAADGKPAVAPAHGRTGVLLPWVSSWGAQEAASTGFNVIRREVLSARWPLPLGQLAHSTCIRHGAGGSVGGPRCTTPPPPPASPRKPGWPGQCGVVSPARVDPCAVVVVECGEVGVPRRVRRVSFETCVEPVPCCSSVRFPASLLRGVSFGVRAGATA